MAIDGDTTGVAPLRLTCSAGAALAAGNTLNFERGHHAGGDDRDDTPMAEATVTAAAATAAARVVVETAAAQTTPAGASAVPCCTMPQPPAGHYRCFGSCCDGGGPRCGLRASDEVYVKDGQNIWCLGRITYVLGKVLTVKYEPSAGGGVKRETMTVGRSTPWRLMHIKVGGGSKQRVLPLLVGCVSPPWRCAHVVRSISIPCSSEHSPTHLSPAG